MQESWDYLLSWFRNSATILWARIQWVIGLIGGGLLAAFSGYDFTQLAAMDGKTAIRMMLMVGLSGVITEFARRRTL